MESMELYRESKQLRRGKMMKLTKIVQRCGGGLSAVLAAFAVTASANTYYVATNGDDDAAGGETTPFATIAKGVSKAAESSEPRKVIVRTGTYKIDSAILISEALTIESETGNPADVIIDGQGVTPLVKWTKTLAATLSGLTLTNGYSNVGGYASAGVYLDGGTVTNCVVTGCLATGNGSTGAYGGGISTYGSANYPSRIIDTRVCKNIASNVCPDGADLYAGGGGIYMFVSGAIVSKCTVEDNCAWFYRENPSVWVPGAVIRGGGIGIAKTATCEIRDSIIRNNIATNACDNGLAGQGGGIYINNSSVVSNCLVYGNMASAQGGGIAAYKSSIVRCTISNNTIHAVRDAAYNLYGAGVYLDGGSKCIDSRVENNRLLGCKTLGGGGTDGGGGGIALTGSTPNLVANCYVADNYAHLGGAFFAKNANDSVISNCLVQGNSATNGGVLGWYEPKNVMVTDCVMRYNIATNGSVSYAYKTPKSDFDGLVFRNSFMYGNTARMGDGSILYGPLRANFSHPLTLDHCTVVSNAARYVVGLNGDPQASNVFLRGNVFFGNRRKSNNAVSTMDGGAILAATTNTCYNFAESATGLNTDPKYGNCTTLTADYFADAAAYDYRLRMGGDAQDKGGPVKDWMGTGGKNGPLDMGDGTMTVVPDGGYGISIVRNNAVPRVKNLPEPGCFELWWPLGFIMSLQ